MKTDATPSARSSRHSAGMQSILNLTLFLGILLMLNYLGFKYYYHKDLSASQYYTLSAKTKEALKKLDSPLTIYTFLDPQNMLQSEQINTLLKEYQSYGHKNVLIEKIDPAYDPTKASELQSKLHFDGNDSLIIFDYKGKEHPPIFVKQADLYEMNPMTGQIGAFKGEQQLTATLLSVIEGKAFKVYFTEGHGEHRLQDKQTQTGYGFVADALKSDNINATSINLAQKGEVPADADAIVIAGPTIQFAPVELQALDKYLAANGKLFILVDPYVVATGLNDLIGKYGMTFDNDLVLYRNKGLVSLSGPIDYTVAYSIIYQGGFSAHPITAKFARANTQILIQNARSLTLTPGGDKANPKTQFLLQTDPSAWGWVSREGAMNVDIKSLTFNKATDLPGPMTISAAYDGGSSLDPAKGNITGTRIVAVGSSKFLENATYEGVSSNFFTNSLDWLVKKDAILDIAPKKPQQYGVSLSPMQFRTVAWSALFFIPGAALVLGILTWLSRRK